MVKHEGEKKYERAFGLERLVFFSDAVFAIAITLMAIELIPPHELEPNTSESLLQALLADWPHFFAFVLSFWIIAVYWTAHHRYFRYIIRYDDGLIARNLLLLFFVVLVPFTTLMLGEQGDLFVATWFYAFNIMALGLCGALIWHHSTQNYRLVDPDLDSRLIRQIYLRAFATPLAAVIVILAAPLIAASANIFFLLIFIFQRVLARVSPISVQEV